MTDTMALSAHLRDSTAAAHARLEALPFATRLEQGRLPLAAYIHFLHGMAALHQPLEQAQPQRQDDRIAAVWALAMSRSAALHQDLAYFSQQPFRAIPAATAATTALASQVQQSLTDQPISAVGYLYVLAGSALGGKVLSKWAARSLRLSPDRGLAYLSGQGEVTAADWREFRQRLDALELMDTERAAVTAAAVQAFAGLHELMAAIHDFDQPD